jgi:hypothetical protein
MANNPSKHVQARIARNKHIPHYDATRDSFRVFWRTYPPPYNGNTIKGRALRRMRRAMARALWRAEKTL